MPTSSPREMMCFASCFLSVSFPDNRPSFKTCNEAFEPQQLALPLLFPISHPARLGPRCGTPVAVVSRAPPCMLQVCHLRSCPSRLWILAPLLVWPSVKLHFQLMDFATSSVLPSLASIRISPGFRQGSSPAALGNARDGWTLGPSLQRAVKRLSIWELTGFWKENFQHIGTPKPVQYTTNKKSYT